MLGGGRSLSFGGGALAVAGALSRGLTVYAARRTRMAYDSGFVPAERTSTAGRAIVYVLLRGWVAWRDPLQRFEGPTALVVPKSLVDGTNGRRPRAFANFGDPLEVLTVECADVEAPAAIESRPIDAAAWRGLGDAQAAMLTAQGSSEVSGGARRAVAALVRARVLPERVGRVVDGPPEAVARVWSGIAETWERGALPSLAEVAARTRTSTRQVQRDLALLGREVLSLGSVPQWRDAMLRMRLKLAVTLLGAPGGTVAEVAASVGYRSSAALARAFRDAGVVASPAEVQRYLRELVSQSIS